MGKCPIIGKRCPESADRDRGCPAWVEGVVEHNPAGDKRAVSDCVLRLLPRWLLQATAASAVNAGELSAMRSGVVRAITQAGERPELPAREVGVLSDAAS